VRPLISIGDPKLMLAAFKRILVEGISVRGAEEVAREIKASEQKKDPTKQTSKLYIPELDEKAKAIQTAWNFKESRIDQTGKQAKLTFVIKGDPEQTTPVIEKLYQTLSAAQTPAAE
jgi:ParB-like chromosome segregation protein Spo0J